MTLSLGLLNQVTTSTVHIINIHIILYCACLLIHVDNPICWMEDAQEELTAKFVFKHG